MDPRSPEIDTFISSMENFNFITLLHMEMLEINANVGNNGPLTTRSTLLANRA